ncbi:DUF6431 domain-containing protein [Cohnella massiliensis]|uniref:DUF6431 domain-containing protein n=1 Tax=Cohnella massiliensis TaxID=1816691 RepID=UPI003CCBDD97
MPPLDVHLREQVYGSIPPSTWSLYQTIRWLRRYPAFFVRCAEAVPCPCCGDKLVVIGSRQRKLANESGEQRLLIVRRLRCLQCRRIHHELPDCIVPYKRYESECIEQVVAEPTSPSVAADDATLRRWKCWFADQRTYVLGALRSISFRFHQDPAEKPSVLSQSAHHGIGRIVTASPGWLARIVRSVTNANLWLHTRSAFLSASS